MDGIVFGGYRFSEPAALPSSALSGWFLEQGGLYAIVAYDTGWGPRPFRPLYFGESDNIWSRATTAHENHTSWNAAVGLFPSLYRALCPLPGWTKSQRQQAESALIAKYGPPCNERLSASLSRLLAGSR